MHPTLAIPNGTPPALFQSEEFSLGKSFTLLSDSDLAILARKLSVPSTVAQALAGWINTRAATALIRPLDVTWRRGPSGHPVCADILLLHMPIATIRFSCPPANDATWLQMQSFVVTQDENLGRAEECPLSEFLTNVLLSEKGEIWIHDHYTRWAVKEIETFGELHPEASLAAASTPAIESCAFMISQALSMTLPCKATVSKLTGLLVHNKDLSEFMLFLKETGALGTFVDLLTSNPLRAGYVWKKREQGLHGLLPILLMAGCRSTPDLEPRDTLRSLGIGNHLARRLRNLPIQVTLQVCEAALLFAWKEFTLAFFRNLAHVLPMLGDQWRTTTSARPKLNMLLMLANRLALLDVLEYRGWLSLPADKTAEFSITAGGSCYLGPEEYGPPCSDDESMCLPIAILRTLLHKVIQSTVDVNDLEHLVWICEATDLLLDWLFRSGEANADQVRQASFDRLTEIAMKWHNEISLVPWTCPADFQWDCGLEKNHLAWREIESGFAYLQNISLISLNNSDLLEKESAELCHCVSTHWYDCANGRTRIFSVVQNNRKRATLEIRFRGRGGWEAVELKGAWNEPLEYWLTDRSDYEMYFSKFCEMYSSWQPSQHAQIVPREWFESLQPQV